MRPERLMPVVWVGELARNDLTAEDVGSQIFALDVQKVTQIARQPVADILLKHDTALRSSLRFSQPFKVQLKLRTVERISLKAA